MKLLVSNLHASRYLREHIANASVNSFVRGDSCIKQTLQTVQDAADIVELTMTVINMEQFITVPPIVKMEMYSLSGSFVPCV